MTTQNTKFRGGVWIGFLASTWPFGTLEVGKDALVLGDESLKRERRLAHAEVEKIEIKKYLPIIGYGIRIIPVDKKKETRLYFWYLSLHFKKLTDALRENGWLGNA